MPAGTSRVIWYESQVRRYTVTAPIAAHQVASAKACGLGAAAIHSRSTGALARDVARPKPKGPLFSQGGSSLVYAAIQNYGGVISGNPLLYIHGKRIGVGGRATRSATGGAISAVASAVAIPGKHYLEVIRDSYVSLMVRELAARMPG